MRSYLSNLECTYCGEIFSADEPMRLCEKCGKVLYPRYDIEEASKYFTKDVMDILDECAKKEFKYGNDIHTNNE